MEGRRARRAIFVSTRLAATWKKIPGIFFPQETPFHPPSPRPVFIEIILLSRVALAFRSSFIRDDLSFFFLLFPFSNFVKYQVSSNACLENFSNNLIPIN